MALNNLYPVVIDNPGGALVLSAAPPTAADVTAAANAAASAAASSAVSAALSGTVYVGSLVSSGAVSAGSLGVSGTASVGSVNSSGALTATALYGPGGTGGRLRTPVAATESHSGGTAPAGMRSSTATTCSAGTAAPAKHS